MAEGDPHATQRGLMPDIPAELRDAGFDDVAEIGHGGFGVVFRCGQPTLDRTVAVKVLTSDLDPENLDRFMREQRAMGRLSGHPHIVQILEVGTTASGRPFIVMPYHAKDSLEALIRRHGPLDWRETLSIGVKLAGALDAAHRVGTLHRDVKPANILLTDYGEPQLTDFGIARIAGGFQTATGVITGSPAFTAPEVLEGATPTSRPMCIPLARRCFARSPAMPRTSAAAAKRWSPSSCESRRNQYRICGSKDCPMTWPRPSKGRWPAIPPIVQPALRNSANELREIQRSQA